MEGNRGRQGHHPELLAQATDTVLRSLVGAYYVWQDLAPLPEVSASSLERRREMVRQADFIIEEALMTQVAVSGLRTRWVSDRHGEIMGWGSPSPGPQAEVTLTAMGVGIEGAPNAVRNWQRGRYGASLSLARGRHPRYGGWLAAGILNYAAGSILYATKGDSAYEYRLDTGDETPVRTSAETQLWGGMPGHAGRRKVQPDDPLYESYRMADAAARTLRSAGLYHAQPSGATVLDAYEVAAGRKLFSVTATRPRGGEQVAALAVIEAAGGVSYALEHGPDDLREPVPLGRRHMLGHDQERPAVLVGAANRTIGRHLLGILRGPIDRQR